MPNHLFCGNTAALLCTTFLAAAAGAQALGASSISTDPSGALQTINANGRTNTNGAFFQSLGTNGRSCSTCHVADQAMSMSPPQIQERFAQTRGRDPLFAAFDGANCPNGNTSQAAAHSLLLSHGLIRIPLAVPANAQFTVTVVHDPYGCALVTDPATRVLTLSTYRRPLPTTNLGFLSTIMFDGRESPAGATTALGTVSTFKANLNNDLTQQAIHATLIHAQAAVAPTAQQLADILSFELGLTTAQVFDREAGYLHAGGALGGALNLLEEKPDYYPGINDVLGADPFGIPFDSSSMTLYAAWENGGNPADSEREAYYRRAARATSPRGKCSSIPRLSPSARCVASMTTRHWAIRCHSKAPARPATIRPMSAIIRCPCHWTLASVTRRVPDSKPIPISNWESRNSMSRIYRSSWSAAAIRHSVRANPSRSTQPIWARA